MRNHIYILIVTRLFNINNRLVFIDSFQFSSSSLDTLVKNLGKNGFKNLGQEGKVIDLVKQKRFYPYEYTSNFEKFKKILPTKDNFYSSLTGKKINNEEYA